MELNNTGNTAVPERNETEVENTFEDTLETEEQGYVTEDAETDYLENGEQNATVPEPQEAIAETSAKNMTEVTTGTTVEANPEYIAQAVAKIDAELKAFTGGQKEKTVSAFVATVLTKFCNDNARFAEVVYKTTRTLSDVCREIMAGTGNQVSDFEVYRGAVQSYFPNADIHCYMSINIIGAPPTDDEIRRAPKVQAPATPAYTPRNQTPVAPAPAKEPEYFETIHLEL